MPLPDSCWRAGPRAPRAALTELPAPPPSHRASFAAFFLHRHVRREEERRGREASRQRLVLARAKQAEADELIARSVVGGSLVHTAAELGLSFDAVRVRAAELGSARPAVSHRL